LASASLDAIVGAVSFHTALTRAKNISIIAAAVVN
jgi:hypothetical protein